MNELVQTALDAMDDRAKAKLVREAIREEVRAAVAPMVQSHVAAAVKRALDAEAARVLNDGWRDPNKSWGGHQYLSTLVRDAASQRAREIVQTMAIDVDVTIKRREA